MLICLDYDQTYDRDPQFWYDFIKLGWKAGHEFILATYRDDRYDRTPLLDELERTIPVYYTRGVAKAWWLSQFAEERYAKPDVWVDDRPKAILENSGLDREGLVKWREDQKAGVTKPQGSYDAK